MNRHCRSRKTSINGCLRVIRLRPLSRRSRSWRSIRFLIIATKSLGQLSYWRKRTPTVASLRRTKRKSSARPSTTCLWTSPTNTGFPKEKPMPCTAATKLPILERDQLASSWRSKEPLLLVGVHSELDEAAATVLASVTEIHGVKGRVERRDALAAPNLAKLDLSGTALICLSSIDMKTPAHFHYAARRLKNRGPHAKLLLAVWSASDDKALNDLKEAVNADYTARTFHQAAAIILQDATGLPKMPQHHPHSLARSG